MGPSTTICLFSGGKFITHIATLQLIERGLATLDDPLYETIPELKDLPVITSPRDASTGEKFELMPRKKDMTLRHMLSNSSGISHESHPLITAWRESGGSYDFPEGTHKIVQMFSAPLLFEPGEGWYYGHDVHFLQVVVERLSGMEFVEYVKKHVFATLDMKASTYLPSETIDIKNKLLQLVMRGNDGKLSPDLNHSGYGITCSIADIQALLTDLISRNPKLLKKSTTDELFGSRLTNAGREAFQREAFEYAKSPANIVEDKISSLVGYTCGGAMIIEGKGLQSPQGTLVWDGMTNIAWAANRTNGVCMFIGTQLLPEYDEKTLRLMKTFFEVAWAKFG